MNSLQKEICFTLIMILIFLIYKRIMQISKNKSKIKDTDIAEQLKSNNFKYSKASRLMNNQINRKNSKFDRQITQYNIEKDKLAEAEKEYSMINKNLISLKLKLKSKQLIPAAGKPNNHLDNNDEIKEMENGILKMNKEINRKNREINDFENKNLESKLCLNIRKQLREKQLNSEQERHMITQSDLIESKNHLEQEYENALKSKDEFRQNLEEELQKKLKSLDLNINDEINLYQSRKNHELDQYSLKIDQNNAQYIDAKNKEHENEVQNIDCKHNDELEKTSKFYDEKIIDIMEKAQLEVDRNKEIIGFTDEEINNIGISYEQNMQIVDEKINHYKELIVNQNSNYELLKSRQAKIQSEIESTNELLKTQMDEFEMKEEEIKSMQELHQVLKIEYGDILKRQQSIIDEKNEMQDKINQIDINIKNIVQTESEINEDLNNIEKWDVFVQNNDQDKVIDLMNIEYEDKKKLKQVHNILSGKQNQRYSLAKQWFQKMKNDLLSERYESLRDKYINYLNKVQGCELERLITEKNLQINELQNKLESQTTN